MGDEIVQQTQVKLRATTAPADPDAVYNDLNLSLEEVLKEWRPAYEPVEVNRAIPWSNPEERIHTRWDMLLLDEFRPFIKGA